METQLLTVKEVAEKLRITRPTLHRLTKSGGLKSIKVGTRVRYDSADIQAFLEDQKREGKSSTVKA